MGNSAVKSIQWLKIITLVSLLFNLFILNITAQGIVKGNVSEVNGNPLPDANLIIEESHLGAATDKDGEYIITDIPAGVYKLKVEFVGYKSIVEDIQIEDDEQIEVNFVLKKDPFKMDQVVVTATRTKMILEDVPVITEVITGQEIEQMGAEDVSEILDNQAGISVETGSSGEKFIYMNGIDSKRIMFLVDNIPLSGKFNDRIQLDIMDSDNIDHIEVVKGPSSTLYGSDAMGGVINIITKKNKKSSIDVNAGIRMGSNDLFNGKMFLSGEKNSISYSLNADRYQKGETKNASEIDIKESFRNTVGGRIGYKNDITGKLELRGNYNQIETESETVGHGGGMNDNQTDVDNSSLSLEWDKSFSENLNFNATSFLTKNFRTYKTKAIGSNSPASIDTTEDKMRGIKTNLNYMPFDKVKADFGFDYSRNNYENSRLSFSKLRKQYGVFGQIQIDYINNLVVNLGLRYDNMTDFDGFYSPRVSAMLKLNEKTKFRTSWGKGFKAPSFIELYSNFIMPIPWIPGVEMMIVGNPLLKPEKSTGFTFGGEYSVNSNILLTATYFQNDFKDMIVDYETGFYQYSYLNVENANFKGMDLQARVYLFENLLTTASYNYTNISKSDKDVAFSRISPHSGVLNVRYSLLQNLSFSFIEKYYSKRDILILTRGSSSFDKTEKGSYYIIDLNMDYKFNKYLKFQAGINNVNDYTDKSYGPYIGRTFFAGISSSILGK